MEAPTLLFSCWFSFNKTQLFRCSCVSLFGVVGLSLHLECFVMFLSSYVLICSMLDLLIMILLMFLEIWKSVSNLASGNYCKSSPFTTEDCSSVRVYIFGISIVVIQHVDSWNVTRPISSYAIRISKYRSNIGFYVIRSVATFWDARAIWIAGNIFEFIFNFNKFWNSLC